MGNEPSIPDPAAEVQAHLDRTVSQLALYARDLKRVVDSERRKSRELAEANARLQILDRLKTDFLTFISHELRTPLVALSAIDILDPQGHPQVQQDMIDIVRQGYERLEEFIQKGLRYFDWLAREKVDTDRVTDLAKLVTRVAGRMPGLAEPGVDCRIAHPDGPCPVRGEDGSLAEVVQVLLANALKFSDDRKSIRVDLQSSPERMTLAVTDNGRGFPPEMAGELFRPFTVADVTHHSRGTGLSLALARAIVDGHGGRIWAESKGVGKGSTFHVEFPAAPSPGL